MIGIGQEVVTRYGTGIVMAGGTPKPLVFVRINSSSQIYVLNSSEVFAADQPETRGVALKSSEDPELPETPLDLSESIGADNEGPPEDPLGDFWRGPMKKRRLIHKSPLSVFVTERLAELGLKQSDFCRQTGFDQGLMSKIQSSMISNLSLETMLRLARGLSVSPRTILELTGRADLHELIVGAYSAEIAEAIDVIPGEAPDAVFEIGRMALRASSLQRDLTPVIEMLTRIVSTEAGQSKTRSAGDGNGDLS